MKDTFKNISQEKQEMIIKAAIDEFGKFGYENASTNRLVKTLGISKGSLFNYFDSKLDLYSHLLDLELEKLLGYMETFLLDKDASTVDQIISYAAFEYDYLSENPADYWFFYQFSKDLNKSIFDQIRTELTEKAIDISDEFFREIGLSDHGLKGHLKLIISSYNNYYLESMGKESDWIELKQQYLVGLRGHLSYVDWRLK